ncbi:FAD-dependent oxidoreductase [Verminephrobacter aporrectodeae subsp. tuberculatae]|uniref:FAD-dependent oxidoreductase n=1 Tax=Verminephrobacter aporrectodeae subsp. tuberculatae TaxID=1110392 RepID=A0ABT3KT13_9BURK|nr:FAD-dependent oxidoreductase [Verminephrobacter aporrectodeae]MCW5257352.1 FAD-dependent oxidoreductase [Verminephrobacter aporrectodeae subsp. tuberculatae]MCW5321463.1 FAD-dependent oxidoreductase [Verminephrobacter aporrectodeae subsp. tuberculatae]
MIRITEIRLPLPADDTPEAAEAPLRAAAAELLGLAPADIAQVQVFRRSIDARKAGLQGVYSVDVALARPQREAALLAACAGHAQIQATPDMAWRPVGQAPADIPLRPVVVGFGPCGIFAALVLAQMGFRPLVLERGKAVRERTRDTWGLWRRRELHAESNVQFGEGGAGTFSDGKLYSQIKDPRYLGRKVLTEFVHAGAPREILCAAHPHIGTFKLVKVVENLRRQIIALGGEIRFQQHVTDVHLQEGAGDRRLRGLVVRDLATGATTQLHAEHVVLALGHSARDSFAMLYARGVAMQAKPFSIGLRVEHPQHVIDRARWGRHAGHPLLGAADYRLVHHAANGRAVYSFCMCPGGTVVAATSEPGCVVTNGMSQYSRNARNANAGLVVGIDPRDYPIDDDDDAARTAQQPFHPLAGIALQRQLESRAFVLGGSDYSAPVQLVGDFIAGRPSLRLGDVQPSYQPGVTPGDLHAALPGYAIEALREALPVFGRRIAGFDMHDAVLTGVETRTSSPLRMERNEDLQSRNTAGLYPAGEGAGYAGGILSAGVDGIAVGEAVARSLLA